MANLRIRLEQTGELPTQDDIQRAIRLLIRRLADEMRTLVSQMKAVTPVRTGRLKNGIEAFEETGRTGIGIDRKAFYYIFLPANREYDAIIKNWIKSGRIERIWADVVKTILGIGS